MPCLGLQLDLARTWKEVKRARMRPMQAEEGAESDQAAVRVKPWSVPQSQLGHAGVHFHVLAIQEPLSACLLQQSSALPPPIIRNLKACSKNEDPEWKWPACARRHRHPPVLLATGK